LYGLIIQAVRHKFNFFTAFFALSAVFLGFLGDFGNAILMTVRHAESPLPLVAVMNLAAVILCAVFLLLFLNRLILTGIFASLPGRGAPSGGSPEQTA
jgi:hypothetical protein